jgi:hypothetical protein
MNTRRRYLVVTDEAARHPFRASLPPHFLRGEAKAVEMPEKRWSITASDWRGFLMAYCAAFIAVTAYIA